MLGQLELVKEFVESQPGVQKLPGPRSISLLAHAKAGGERAASVYNLLGSRCETRTPRPPFLTWTRKETMGRWRFHLGQRVFYPAGASAVRICFVEENNAMVMTVSDPDVVLRANLKK